MMPIWVLMFLAVAAAAPLDDDKIIGGYECTPHSQPWQVYLTQNGDRWCGGSLISPRWIISAAHCYVPPKTMVAHLGEHDLNKKETTEQHIQVENIYMHHGYNEDTYDNDIMLVKLAEPAQYNQYVQPIPVARSCPKAATECLVSGYGNLLAYGVKYADQLQCLDLPILSESSCKASYPKKISENMFCAGFLEGGKDSCQNMSCKTRLELITSLSTIILYGGDSGGPLICNGELYGVVSWGWYCARKDLPGVYAKVCNYLDWIQDITNNN
ncbi:serine protease 3 S homeolog isoform X2 [Xenopus laevis]|uniref:Serine protease 3 S homeolog isoform X2 n=1 Tax=Xenopus laevis TaxID=8355 RepID=A0A8J1LBU4_XENLA|nr:serine protease 3 S homeolog isoform X2 [Xenopus laevis]